MRLSDAVIDEINNIRGFKTTSGELILEEKAELITKIVNRLLHEVTADPDTVSRQAARDAVCEELDSIDHIPQWVFDRLTKKIENVPSAQPERETAKFIRWMEIKKTDEYISYTPHCKCSKCGTEFLIENIKYCYMCGAKMEDENESD